jgi:preprotein translocase subunit SecA
VRAKIEAAHTGDEQAVKDAGGLYCRLNATKVASTISFVGIRGRQGDRENRHSSSLEDDLMRIFGSNGWTKFCHHLA